MSKNSISICSIIFIFCLTVDNVGFALDWTTSVVDDAQNFTMFESNGIFIDNNNYPHIVYGGDHLYYSYLDETGWHHETVDTSRGVGTHARIAIDSFGKVHIIYFDTKFNCLKYATNSSNTWEIEFLDISPSLFVEYLILLFLKWQICNLSLESIVMEIG